MFCCSVLLSSVMMIQNRLYDDIWYTIKFSKEERPKNEHQRTQNIGTNMFMYIIRWFHCKWIGILVCFGYELEDEGEIAIEICYTHTFINTHTHTFMMTHNAIEKAKNCVAILGLYWGLKWVKRFHHISKNKCVIIFSLDPMWKEEWESNQKGYYVFQFENSYALRRRTFLYCSKRNSFMQRFQNKSASPLKLTWP